MFFQANENQDLNISEEYSTFQNTEGNTSSLDNQSLDLVRNDNKKHSESNNIVKSILFDMIGSLDFEQKVICEENKSFEGQRVDDLISENEKEDKIDNKYANKPLELNSKNETDFVVQSVLADIIGSLVFRQKFDCEDDSILENEKEDKIDKEDEKESLEYQSKNETDFLFSQFWLI